VQPSEDSSAGPERNIFSKLKRRQAFPEQQLSEKQETLTAVRKEVGHPLHEAV
jgi:hypothetical protein